ncbi:LysE family translocator [uncultured Marinobacter sp.]|uniref:LysE family translocator n=1 Tax=uncultured Marinobacter sp. TaxID=187379 RepID=UPI0030D98893
MVSNQAVSFHSQEHQVAIESWITFVVMASIILVMPGPTIIYVVGKSLLHGKKAAVPLSAGVILGDAICILFSLLGLSALLAISSLAFTTIKWLGAVYLIYLGFTMLISSIQSIKINEAPEPFDAKRIFRNVFAITALNPKGIIFYSALMPQFVSPAGNVLVQFVVLGATFLTLALLNTLCYSLLSGKFSELFRSRIVAQWFNGTSGLALVGAGVVAAGFERYGSSD